MNKEQILQQYKRKAVVRNRLIFVQAVLLTVLVHAVLYYLFVLPPKNKAPVASVFRNITVVNLSDKEKNKEYLELFKYANPTLISNPNRIYGYGTILKREGIPYIREDDNLEKEIRDDLIQRHQPSNQYHAPKWTDYQPHEAPDLLDFKPDQLTSPDSVKVNDNPPRTSHEYPLCIDMNGVAYAIFAKPDAVKSLIKSFPPTANTVIRAELTETTTLPMLKIEQSCGNAMLDKIAFTNLLRNRRMFEKALKKAGNELTLTIKWKGKP